MSDNVAYLIGHVTVKDAEKWAEYRNQVPATLAPFGAELVLRGKRVAVFSGEHPQTDTVVIRFPSVDAMRAWHASPGYQALIPLRDKVIDAVLVGYESWPG